MAKGSLIAICALAMALAVNCGGDSPTQPTLPGMTVFAIFPDQILIGPGDNVQIIGLAAASVAGEPVDVSDRMRLESSNPAIVRVQGSTVTAVSPGEAEVRATFQSLNATTRVAVFASSSLSRLAMYGASTHSSPCWPNEEFELSVYAVLDDGRPATEIDATWRSTGPAVASVDPNGARGRVTCHAPGQATIEASYLGKTATMAVAVRAPQDTLEARGSSTQGVIERGRTVTIGNSGWYVLESAESGEIVQTVATSDGAAVAPDATFPIRRGSGPWQLSTRFVVPATATELCTRVVMRDSSREIAATKPSCQLVR